MAALVGELVTERFEYDGGRGVTVYVPPDRADAVVFAADGGWHTERLCEALEAAEVGSTMIVGVHGMPDDDGRLHEYVPGFDPKRFAAHQQFFVRDVGAWVESRFGLTPTAERTAVWGASLGGELALALGVSHPDRYGVVFSASPGAGYQPPPVLPSPLPRCYLVAGTQEPFFLENATRWSDAFEAAGADVVLRERDGGHGDVFWAEELPRMVSWAFGS